MSILAPTLIPLFANIAKPLAKAAIMSCIQLYERGKETFTEVAQITEDIVAEAKAELSESTAAAAAAPAVTFCALRAANSTTTGGLGQYSQNITETFQTIDQKIKSLTDCDMNLGGLAFVAPLDAESLNPEQKCGRAFLVWRILIGVQNILEVKEPENKHSD